MLKEIPTFTSYIIIIWRSHMLLSKGRVDVKNPVSVVTFWIQRLIIIIYTLLIILLLNILEPFI